MISLSIFEALPLSDGHFPGTKYLFQQVFKDRLLTGMDIDYNSHVRY